MSHAKSNRYASKLMVGLAGLAVAATFSKPACAFSVNITPGSREIYLQVGNGSFTGTFNIGGIPGNNTTVNLVSVSVPASAVGNGASRTMTTNSTQSNSFWDGYAFCNAPAQMYIGGFYRQPGTGGAATLSITSPASLTTTTGSSIPFSQIHWVSSGNGDTGTEAIPSGAFTGGTQTLATFGTNTWNESCHVFSYANTNLVDAGVYTGRVTYTLSAP